MKTITLQIGNTDNKLTQRDWAAYCNAVHRAITFYVHDIPDPIHFSAPSVGWADWQNAAWVFSCGKAELPALKKRVVEIRTEYKQDSVAWLEGETQFI